jgi:hypothetical protein
VKVEGTNGATEQMATSVAEAADVAAGEVIEAIGVAAELNDDPEVAVALDDAAIHAEKSAARTGWLRRFVDQLKFVKPNRSDSQRSAPRDRASFQLDQ